MRIDNIPFKGINTPTIINFNTFLQSVKTNNSSALDKDVFVRSTDSVSTKVTESEISQLYEKIYSAAEKEMSDNYGGIKMIKPQIVFQDDGPCAYGFATNNINISRKILNGEFLISKDNSDVWDEKVAEDFSITTALYNIVDKEEAQKIVSENPNLKIATKAEKMAILTACLRHELEHAAQNQCALSIEGTFDKFLDNLAKDLDFDKEILSTNEGQELIKEYYPFMFNFKPSKKIDSNSNIECLKKAKVNFDEFKNSAFIGTDSTSGKKYYTNVNEILARQSEVDFWQKHAKNMFPDLSDDFIKCQSTAMEITMVKSSIESKKNYQ